MNDINILNKRIEDFNITLSDKQLSQFDKYYELLVKTNEVMNLTAITEFDEVILKHFVDSLSIVKAFDIREKNYSLIDVGTGAGFPGIPLNIAFDNLDVTLLDSLNKRVGFLNNVIDSLGLVNIKAVHGRAEDYAKPNLFREKYDIVVSRAVANLSTLSEYCLPYVKVGGYFIPYKSEKMSEEVSASTNALNILGGKLIDVVNFNLPGSDLGRNIAIISKVKETPKKYPRKAGTPSKEPLI